VQTIQESITAGLSGLLIIASTLDESIEAQRFCHEHNSDEFILRFTAGVHPHYASAWSPQHYTELKKLLSDKYCVAVGECGLDFNRNYSSPQQQQLAFIQQLKLANETGKGLYLHERDAWQTQLELLKKYGSNVKFKIVHCFTGGKRELDSYLELGCYIGITGWLCDAKRGSDLRQCVSRIPLERLLVETDAPYLFPKTIRPRSANNHPKYLTHIIKEIAELISVDADIIKMTTEKNALALFCNNEGRTQHT